MDFQRTAYRRVQVPPVGLRSGRAGLGTAWHGRAAFGLAWRGMEQQLYSRRCLVRWCLVKRGTARHGEVGRGTVGYGMARRGRVRSGAVRSGQAWTQRYHVVHSYYVVWLGLVWLGQARRSRDRQGAVWPGWVRQGAARHGKNRQPVVACFVYKKMRVPSLTLPFAGISATVAFTRSTNATSRHTPHLGHLMYNTPALTLHTSLLQSPALHLISVSCTSHAQNISQGVLPMHA
jgi:hypothetical protein